MSLEAIILAGGISSTLNDLTSKSPKCILPVGNQPMIYYPIKTLEKAGLKDALVVVNQKSEKLIRKELELCADIKLRLRFEIVPDDDDLGTADSLRKLRLSEDKREIILLSCDLITDLDIHHVLDSHRTNSSALTMVLSPSIDARVSSVPGGKAYKKIERDVVALDEKTSRVLRIGSEVDFGQNFPVRKSLLKKYPCWNVRTNLADAHLYIINRSVFECVRQNESFSSFRKDLLPWLVRQQFRRVSKTTAKAEVSNDKDTEVLADPEMDKWFKDVLEMSSYNDHSGDLDSCYHGDRMRCYAYVKQSGLCTRANSMVTYWEANKLMPLYMKSQLSDGLAQAVHPRVTQAVKCQIGIDCFVGEGTNLSEGVNVKKSVIGRHCMIGSKSTIADSIIMDHVTIKDNCQIVGSIISSDSHLGDGCEIRTSIVGSTTTLNPRSKLTGEVQLETSKMITFM